MRGRQDGELFNIVRLDSAPIRPRPADTRAAARKRCCFNIPQLGRSSVRSRQAVRCLREFGLTISLKKTNIMAHGAKSPPSFTIGDTQLEVVDAFTYWLHRDKLDISRHRDQLKNCYCCRGNGQTKQASAE